MVLRDGQENFWSRRRAAVEAEAAAEAAARDAAEQRERTEAQQAALADKTDAEILAELQLSDPDTMGQGDDFAAFMRSAVPEHLRRRALRRLWRSNPVLANLDGLVDHGEDFSDAATVVPDMKTAYQVGKGMMKHVMALAEEAAAPIPGPDEPVLAAEAAVEMAETATDPEAEEPAVPLYPQTAPDEAPVAPRRHMRFAFVEPMEGRSA